MHKYIPSYPMAYESGSIADFDSSQVDGALWLPLERAIARASFPNEKDILRKAQQAWKRRVGE